MTIADSRVVAHRFRIRTSDGGKGCWVHDEGPSKYGDKTANGMEYQDLTPLTLLAEAESALAACNELSGRRLLSLFALQSRLDAVVAVLNRYQDGRVFSDLHTRQVARAIQSEIQNDISRAALGGESPANDEELK